MSESPELKEFTWGQRVRVVGTEREGSVFSSHKDGTYAVDFGNGDKFWYPAAHLAPAAPEADPRDVTIAALQQRNDALEQALAAVEAERDAAKTALRELVEDMRIVDWQFVPQSIVDQVNAVLGQYAHRRWHFDVRDDALGLPPGST